MCSVVFLFAWCVIMPLFIFSCSSGKSMENNTIFRDSIAVSKQKDSMNVYASVRTDTYAHNSIYRWDSVTVFIKGDTIVKDRWHLLTNTKQKTIYVTDTLFKETYKLRVDTLKMKYYVNRWKAKETEKSLTMWQKVRLFIDDCVLLFLLLLAVYWAKERLGKEKE